MTGVKILFRFVLFSLKTFDNHKIPILIIFSIIRWILLLLFDPLPDNLFFDFNLLWLTRAFFLDFKGQNELSYIISFLNFRPMKKLLLNLIVYLIVSFIVLKVKKSKARELWYLNRGYPIPKKSKRYLECVRMTKYFYKLYQQQCKGGKNLWKQTK